MLTKEYVEKYLRNYKKTRATEMDSLFKLFKSDVSELSESYRYGNVYIYNKEEYIEYKMEYIEDFIKNMEYSKDYLKELFSEYNEVLLGKGVIFIEESGVEGFIKLEDNY